MMRHMLRMRVFNQAWTLKGFPPVRPYFDAVDFS
jgi:hypothetical protein